MTRVAIARNDDIEAAIEQALRHVDPLGGKAVETGLVIASSDAISADTVGAKLLRFNSQAVRHLWEAGKVGLGETDPGAMEFPGMSLEEAVRAFTARAYGEALTF